MMGTYTRDDFKQLRDILIEEAPSLFGSLHGPTVKHLFDCLFMDPNPQKIEKDLLESSRLVHRLPSLDNDIDYTTAYNVLFGDMSHLPLHINDALLPVVRWRLNSCK